MKTPAICTTIINNDLQAISEVEPLTDLFEVRIDLIGNAWPEIAGYLNKPWIACNRLISEGGSWQGDETGRIAELIKATELGASIVDIELATIGLSNIMPLLKTKARCLLSFHDLAATQPLEDLKKIVELQLQMGADICKVVTTARNFNDNLPPLQLIAEYPKIEIISFAMGAYGTTSRVLCPLVGGKFTYASLGEGNEAAPGQLTVTNLRNIYRMMKI